MTQINQVGGWSVPGGDVTFHNYGGSDIPDGTIVLYDTSNPGSLTQAPGCVVPTASGAVSPVAGITIGVIPAGGAGTVRQLGAAAVTADGSVTSGDSIQASNTASKMGRGKTCGAGIEQVGKAYGNASDGDQFVVILHIARNA